jgi:arabinose-5-phosphate isomerase
MDEKIKKIALDTIDIEAEAVRNLKSYINSDFVQCVSIIYHSRGRVVVSGIGKSAIIASKIVATLNSTGTPAIFMHAADAIHGDLGIIQPEDTVICISKSGNTPEIKVLVPLLKNSGNTLIGMVGNMDSYLAKQADYVLNTSVDKEACPNNLAPTSSSTAQLVMGDALAVSLLKFRGFTSEDFARYHPGGALGKRLYMKVSDIYIHNQKPAVSPEDSIRSVILEISGKRLGATAVVKDGNRLCGIITDGDLRRMLERTQDFSALKAADIMSAAPKTVNREMLAIEALELMKEKNLNQLLVTESDNNSEYVGVIHIQDMVKEGIL